MSATPPHSLEAEENVLGAILLAQKVPAAVIDTLSPSHFYRKSNATVYQAALSLHSQSKPTDAVSMADELEKMGQLKNIGGPSRLADCQRRPSLSRDHAPASRERRCSRCVNCVRMHSPGCTRRRAR